MNYKLIPLAVTAAMCLASCTNDELVEKNLNPTGDAITFSTRVGHASRSEVTTVENLGNFWVYGKAVYKDHTLYEAYLIGNADGKPELATRREPAAEGGTTASWTLDRDVYLPHGIDNAAFWAFTDLKKGETANSLSSGTVSFNNTNGPLVEGYTIAKADLTASGLSVWTDGSNQRDLVAAFGQAKKTDGTLTNHIDLTFNHMLSKVTLKAAQKDQLSTDSRVVKIKGAWFVNVKESGKLAAGYEYGAAALVDKPTWDLTGADATTYGTYYQHAIDLSGYKTEAGALDLTYGNPLMLIPQQVNAWNPAADAEYNTTTTGYIMLLCRVELKHKGATHGGADASGDDIFVEAGFHYHQQFPVNTTGKFNAKEYGLTCIPVTIDWQRGKSYTCYLNICGKGAGAGIYPPKYGVDELTGKLIPESDKGNVTLMPIPSGKNPGDKVLDDPISFTVSVAEWGAEEENPTWNNGN